MVEPLKSSYDLIVIGAGPAGSITARAAAKKGVRVLLIDQRQRIGTPVQCAELVSQLAFHHTSLNSRAIIQTTEAMVIHFPDRTTYKIKSPGYMLERCLFDKELATSAVLSGAELSTATKAIQVSTEGILVQRGRREEWIGAKVIVGADGVHSTVARLTNQPPLKEMSALQYEVVLFKPQSHTDIYFHPDYEGGYAWLFPKGDRANAGIGIIASKSSLLPELLNRFLNHLKDSQRLTRIEILSKTGGSIPCEPRGCIVFGNILLAGDAGGHAHPITGAGILNAMLSGEIAGRIAAEAIVSKDFGILKNYEKECYETFGKSLRYGFLKRNLLEENWNKSGFSFKELIQKTWVGFKEYYQDRRNNPHLFMGDGERKIHEPKNKS